MARFQGREIAAEFRNGTWQKVKHQQVCQSPGSATHNVSEHGNSMEFNGEINGQTTGETTGETNGSQPTSAEKPRVADLQSQVGCSTRGCLLCWGIRPTKDDGLLNERSTMVDD